MEKVHQLCFIILYIFIGRRSQDVLCRGTAAARSCRPEFGCFVIPHFCLVKQLWQYVNNNTLRQFKRLFLQKKNHAVFTYSQLGQIQDLSGMVGYSLHFQQTCKCFLSKSTGCLHFSWVEVEVYEPLPPIWIRSQCRGHPLPLVMKKGAPNWLKRKKIFGLLTNKAIVFILYKLIFILPVIEIKRTQH